MVKTKIKDMTPSQLKAYRNKQYAKLKKKKEKEEKQAERDAIRRSKAAKKATATKKKKKKQAEKEAAKQTKIRSKSAKKAATTRKRNAITAKKELINKKKVELESKRIEKRKNKIVVPRSKPIKDMTQEEYSEYKKAYAQIYNERKRKKENKEINENVKRRLSGKALNVWNIDNGKSAESPGIKFSGMTENKRYVMHPRVDNKVVTCRAEGLNAYCEITAATNLYVTGRKKIVEVSLSCFVLPDRTSGNHISVRDFWTKNVSDMIPKLTDRNFYSLLQPITNKELDKVMEWPTIRFIKACIDYGQKHKQMIAEILWQTLDKDYAKKHNITDGTLDQMAKSRKKRVNKNYDQSI